MKYNRNLLKVYGSGEVKSIRYKNYPIPDTRIYYSTELHSMPLSLHSTGSDIWHCRVYSERTNSSILSLEYVQEGEFVFTQNGETCHVLPGEIFIVYPGKNSSFYCEPLTARKRLIILKGCMHKIIAENLGLDKINKFVPQDRQKIDDFYDKIEASAQSGSNDGYYHACSLCYNLLLEIARQNNPLKYPPELQKVLDYINYNLYRKITLRSLVKNSGISSTALNLLFHQYFNTSPIEYCIDRKLELAKNLLLHDSCSIKEIAVQMEYPSPQYFATKFKEKYGCSPSAIRDPQGKSTASERK